MQNQLLIRSILLFLITTCFALSLQESSSSIEKEYNKNNEATHKNDVLLRVKRATKNPGFFRTLFSVIFEQWNDTKNTFGSINNLINNNFLPENVPVTPTTTSSDTNVSTTEAPYRITRTKFNKILRRNLRGLQRLFNIELQDALQQSQKTNAEYKKNASVEISKFL